MTTVQLAEKTKRKLLEIAAKLQLELKKKVSLDDAVSYLVRQYESKGKDARMFSNFFGCLKKEEVAESYNALKGMRDIGEQRLKRLEHSRS